MNPEKRNQTFSDLTCFLILIISMPMEKNIHFRKSGDMRDIGSVTILWLAYVKNVLILVKHVYILYKSMYFIKV